MIYFIVEEGFHPCVKIGYSGNSGKRRLSSLQIGNPRKLSLCWEFFGDQVLEGRVHKLFSEFFIRGEWFWYTDECDNLLDRLVAAVEGIAEFPGLTVEHFLQRVDSWISTQLGRRTEDDVKCDIEECCGGWV